MCVVFVTLSVFFVVFSYFLHKFKYLYVYLQYYLTFDALMGKKINFLLLTVICIFVSSCKWQLKPKSTKQDEVNITVLRYDKLLMDYVSANSFSSLQKMNTDFSLQTKFLLEDVLELGKVDDPDINTKLRTYFSDTTLMKLDKTALLKYKDMGDVERNLTKGFKALKKEIPSLPVPVVYSQLSALNQSVVVGDSILGFSIDKYLGADYPMYKDIFFDYQRRYMTRSRIVPDCFLFYLMREYPFDWGGDRTLMEQIIYKGKIHWVIAKILGMPLDEEIGYSKFETQWAQENRSRVWKFMLRTKQLESRDRELFNVYLRPASFNRYYGETSPGLLGVWLGTHLVDEYMQKNSQVTMLALLQDNQYKKILLDALK